MTLAPGCPRCSAPVMAHEGGFRCSEHGDILPFWVPPESTYDAFADHVRRTSSMPTLLPWPMGPGWSITRFGSVGAEGGDAKATAVACAGTSMLDGPVEVTVVSEEPGIGLGARIAGLVHDDPGPEVGAGSPSVRVRIDSHPVPLWSVSTAGADTEFDRTVFVGEAHGRWLWVVLRPPSAALLMVDDWILADVTEFGPELIEMSFGGPPPVW